MATYRRNGRFCTASDINRISKFLATNVNAAGDNRELQPSWKSGRRIIELGFLAEQLFCNNCNSSLQLADIVTETKFGLASLFYISCQQCGTTTTVSSGKRHKLSEDGDSRCFDINSKLAAAMLNAGVGETQISNILAALNIPQPSPSTIKKREREVGSCIERVAQISCDDVLDKEKKAVLETCDTGAKVVLDGGWQKRGSGRTSNSMSGHVMVIGSRTKRCIDFGVAKKSCRICKSTAKKATVRKHDCRKNYNGSSKGMESFLAVKTLKRIEEKGLKISQVVMDDDSTTYSRIKSSLNDEIIKCSDNNHVSKNFTNELFKIQGTCKCLSKKKITYLQKCFNYAVAQNKCSPRGIRDNIQAILPHVYGTHELCKDKQWCNYHDNQTTYKHKSLPHGKDFTDLHLKERLGELFSKYTSDEMLNKLSRLESSNVIENMNQLVARKAPTAVHYSASESLDYRVSAAILQKNEGHMYMCKVNEQNALSPGKYTVDRFTYLDRKHAQRRKEQETQIFKKRRIHLKDEKRHCQDIHENLEGTTYGVDPLVEIEPEALLNLPEPVPNPRLPSIGTVNNTIVVFDLETTGFDMNSDIIQIAAKKIDSGETFSRHVVPTRGKIPAPITRLTGISYSNGHLSQHGTQVAGSSLVDACNDFHQFIHRFSPVILVAHNVLFDSKVLITSFKKCNLQYANTIHGFGDTLKLFRKEHPQRKEKGLGYKQVDLVKDILEKNYVAHNANEDVMTLCKLLETVYRFDTKLPVYSTSDIENRMKRAINLKTNIDSYKVTVECGVMSVAKSKSLASAGMTLPYLRIIYTRSGVEGLHLILKCIFSSPATLVTSLSDYFDKA